MRLILILATSNSVHYQVNPTKQNLLLPGLEIEHNASSGFYFQRTATLRANQRFAHIATISDLNFSSHEEKKLVIYIFSFGQQLKISKSIEL